jgi:hypothetical protein
MRCPPRWRSFRQFADGFAELESGEYRAAPFRTTVHINAFLEIYRCQRDLEEGAELAQLLRFSSFQRNLRWVLDLPEDLDPEQAPVYRDRPNG